MNYPALLIAASLLSACDSKKGEIPPPPVSSKEAAQKALGDNFRWPLSDTEGVNSRQVEDAINRGDRDEAVALLDARLAPMSHEEALAAITPAGALKGDTREKLFKARDRAYYHALRWYLNGDEAEAQKSREILSRFAEVISQWPLYSRKEKPFSQDDRSYLQDPEANGLWGGWHPLDLAGSVPLLRAYDILQPVLPPEEKAQLENNLFIYHKRLLEKFTGQMPRYTNLSAHHLVSLIRFGQVLEKPEYIHEVVRYWREILTYSYSVDGFFREISPSYHRQITLRLTDRIPAMLKGYSDPADYRDPISKERFDRLDLAAEKKEVFQQMRDGLDVLALPDGNLANLNDSWYGQPKTTGGADQPGLLGISGVAKLNTGGMSAVLKFGGIRGHDHRDALGLVWFAAGEEVFSETSYREKGDIKFDRAWSASTASHHTAAIDEELHFSSKDKIEVPTPIRRAAYVSGPPANPGQSPVEAVNPVAARYLNQGRLLVWNCQHAEAQAMEAEQENAYPGKATLFRRTLVMVPLADGNGYLVEIFRMKGGSMHDYFLRGSLNKEHTLTFDQPLEPVSGSVYAHLKLQQAGAVRPPLQGTAAYANGVRVTSSLAGVFGSPAADLQLMVGEGAAIRRPGRATFSLLRRKSAEGNAPLETCWVWVHEATKGDLSIENVAANYSEGNVVITVALKDRKDLIFSAIEESGQFQQDGFKFNGRLAFASLPGNGAAATGTVFQGGALTHGSPVATGTPAVKGSILATTRREAGEPTDSVLLQPDAAVGDTASLRLAHIDFGHGVRFSIPIREVIKEPNGQLRAVLAHPPGFIREENAARMTHFPGWRVTGETRIRLE